jgi:hypothetical protein
MNKLCTLVGAVTGGYAGWYFASALGVGWAFIVSGLGGMIGVYLGWKLAQRLS